MHGHIVSKTGSSAGWLSSSDSSGVGGSCSYVKLLENQILRKGCTSHPKSSKMPAEAQLIEALSDCR